MNSSIQSSFFWNSGSVSKSQAMPFSRAVFENAVRFEPRPHYQTPVRLAQRRL
jgi:hypothetical protein